MAPPAVPFRLLATLWLAAGLAAQEAVQEATRAVPVFADGEAQVVDAFSKPSEWIREALWVETTFDSDGDGRPDRMHVDVTRPRQTETEGLKVPVVYETSPYFTGIGSTDSRYFWDPKHELGAEPPPRTPMPAVRSTARPDRIATSEVRRWLPRGYAVVHSCSPGTGLSQGCVTIGGENESLAPKAVIDWLCGRAKGYTTIDGGEPVTAHWCSGKVGMIGTSYNGTLPIAAATTGVEGLAAIIPIAPNTSYYLYYRSHGLVRHPGGYMGEDVDVLYDFVNSGNPARRGWCNENVRDGLLKKQQDRLTGDFNDFWFTRDYLRHIDRVRAATLVVHGWNDWNVMPEHSVRIHVALRQRDVPCMAFFHQGGHEGAPPFSLCNRWFTRFLHGVDNGIEAGPRSWIVREGETEATPYADYPHPDAVRVALHPRAGGGAIGGLERAPAPGQGRETLVDDVAVPGAKLAQAAESPQRLLYATPPLAQPLHLSGTARVQLRLACSKPATNLSVWLVTLPWQGAETKNVITRGWADPQNRNSLSRSEPLVPGEFVDVAFDLQPDDQILAAGLPLALMVFASDRDFTLWPKPGTELTLDLDASVLTLPVVGGEAALAAALGASDEGGR
ncbi:MAG: Xaa-Pro dipeptidyl-peptidase [Planctomycetes bacterium]|nr:Xaa-Pro dipeptidyl-peptidase [Planctomycetota bacterium]